MKLKFLLLPVFAAAIACGKDPVINRVPLPGGEEETQTTLPEADGNTLKVCSFNIRYFNTSDPFPWSVRKDPVMKFIRDKALDFIGLQEIRSSQAQDFTHLLGNDYGYYDINRDTGQGVSSSNGEGVGILYRKDRFDIEDKGFFWLAEPSDKLPEKNTDGTFSSWNSACRRVVVWVKAKDKKHSDKTVYFFATHFDHKSSSARLNSSTLSVAKLKEIAGVADLESTSVPIFLVADFNCKDGSAELAPIMDKMKYARTAAPTTDDGRTYNGFGETSSSIIDHIFYTGDLTPKVYDVVTEDYGVKYISDHYPIMFEASYK